MALSDDAAAQAAATLTAAIVSAGGISPVGADKEAVVREAMDVYRRSLNVIRKAAGPTSARKTA